MLKWHSWTNFVFRENILGLENGGGMGVENYYEEIPTYSDEKNLILEFGRKILIVFKFTACSPISFNICRPPLVSKSTRQF
jgi:hypothetical protein